MVGIFVAHPDGRRPGPADRRVVLQRRRQDSEVHRVRAVVHAGLLDGQHLDRRHRAHPHDPRRSGRAETAAPGSPRSAPTACRTSARAPRDRGRHDDQTCRTSSTSVDEKDVTVDWFFGTGTPGTKVAQLVLLLVGWFFAVLPVVITASALLHRDDEDGGWWGYQEGFVMWDETMQRSWGSSPRSSSVGFLVLYLVNRAASQGTQPAKDLRRGAPGPAAGDRRGLVRRQVRPRGPPPAAANDPDRALRRHRDLRAARHLPRQRGRLMPVLARQTTSSSPT